MKNVGNVHAAALIAHGNMDLNVMTKNFDQFYTALQARRASRTSSTSTAAATAAHRPTR